MAARATAKLSIRATAPARLAPLARPRLVAARPPSSLPVGRRLASHYPTLERPPRRGIKVAHLFSALALLGIGATSYGLFQFYQSFTAYPDTASHPIRSKLRAALRAHSAGEHERSSTFFSAAYDLALDLYARGDLAPTYDEAVERLTGIAIRWGAMWESVAETARAIEAYDTGFQPVAARVEAHQLGTASSSSSSSGGAPPTPVEVRRGAAIAVKLGDLWLKQGGSAAAGVRAGEADSEAERYYTWAVQELMRLSLSGEQKAKVRAQLVAQEALRAAGEGEGEGEKKGDKGGKEGEDELKVPGWVGEVELVAAMERLGELYSRLGRIELAQPLLQQAITILFPPPPKEGPKPPLPPIPQRCHAATLMNNLSSALVSAASPSAAQIQASAGWSRQALIVSNGCRSEAAKTRKKRDGAGAHEVPLAEREERECELTAIVASYNLGKLSEMSKDPDSAEQWFVQSGTHATKLGLHDAARQSNEAIRRLKGAARARAREADGR